MRQATRLPSRISLPRTARPARPRSYRYAEEQRAIESWLSLVTQAAALSTELAREVAECARLVDV